ncbi:MAG: hypothetical protein ACETWG_08080 [Candidatus Neomarinimicrobiota bacterium]
MIEIHVKAQTPHLIQIRVLLAPHNGGHTDPLDLVWYVNQLEKPKLRLVAISLP